MSSAANMRLRPQVAITGAAGFVGKRLVERLLQENCTLVLLLRNIASAPAEWRGNASIELVDAGDLEKFANAKPALTGSLALVHLAGIAGTRGHGELEYFRINRDMTLRLAAAAAEAGVSNFIYLSSVFARTEPGHTEPATAYGRSKRAGEDAAASFASADTLAVSLRPPLITGAEAKSGWRALMRLAASGLPLPFKSLTGRRSYCSAELLADVICHLSLGRWPAACSGTYDICERDALPLGGVIAALRKGMGRPPRLFAAPPPLFSILERAPGIGGRIKSLTEARVLDPEPFFARFGIQPQQELSKRIESAGRQFRANAGNAGHL